MAIGLFSFSYRDVTVAILTTSTQRIISNIESLLSDNLFVMWIISKIKAELENLKAAAARDPSSSYTKLIFDKDKIRDNRYNGLGHLLKNIKLLSEDPDAIRAADVLLHIIEKLGSGVANKSYSSETQALNVLFKELESSQAVEAIKTLGIDSEITKLRDAQKDFENVVQNKVDEKAVQYGPAAIETYRKVYKYLGALLDHIAFNASEDVVPFTNVVPLLNEIIKEANASIGHSPAISNDEVKEKEAEATAA